MKKILKIGLLIITIIIIYIIVDIIYILNNSKPLISIKDELPYKYNSLFYDVYNCPEYSVAQIKSKWSKYTCATINTNLGKIKSIKDTTKDMKNFSCAEALEQFYEDDRYQYFYNCVKSKYIIVEYENGHKQTVTQALKHKRIKISDLDNYSINYIKYEK